MWLKAKERMLNQRKSNNRLLYVYGKLVSLCVVLTIMTILSFRYFTVIEQTSLPSLKMEQNRLINVLAMVHSQWLIQGRPREMNLDWLLPDNEIDNHVLISEQGWPTLLHINDQNCEKLWRQLLGHNANFKIKLTIEALPPDICTCSNKLGQQLRFQLGSNNIYLQ